MLEFTAAMLSSVMTCTFFSHWCFLLSAIIYIITAICCAQHNNVNTSNIPFKIIALYYVLFFFLFKNCINQLRPMSPQPSGILFRIKWLEPRLTFDLCATQSLSTMSNTFSQMWPAVKTDVEKWSIRVKRFIASCLAVVLSESCETWFRQRSTCLHSRDS